MIRQELDSSGLDVGFEAVKLDAVLVVDEHVLLLCDGKVRLVVKEPGNKLSLGCDADEAAQYLRDVPTCLLQLELRVKRSSLPVKSCDVSQ